MQEKTVCSKSFLGNFTDSLRKIVGEGLNIYSKKFAKASLSFVADFNCDEQMSRAETIRLVTDKIMAIIAHPHIKVSVEEVMLRSELSGALSHESFSETLRDPKVWKNKNGSMTPEYVHTVENVDTINTYENQFISMFIDELSNEIDLLLGDIAPLVESLQEHFERTDKTFGEYSMFKDFADSTAPFSPFLLSSDKQDRENLLMLAKKLKKRLQNLKDTEFYKLTSNKKLNHSIVPTNVLIHDPRYNFCYKTYISSFGNNVMESKENDLYYNYVVMNFVRYLGSEDLLTKNNEPSLTLDEHDRVDLKDIEVRKNDFSLSFRFDKENYGIECEVQYLGNKQFDNVKNKATYYFLIEHAYTERNRKVIESLLDSKKGYDDVLLITGKNVVRHFSDVLNISYYKEDAATVIRNAIASFTMLFDASVGLYRERCPFCGSEKIIWTGLNYICEPCGTSYSVFPKGKRELVWLTNIGRRK